MASSTLALIAVLLLVVNYPPVHGATTDTCAWLGKEYLSFNGIVSSYYIGACVCLPLIGLRNADGSTVANVVNRWLLVSRRHTVH